MRAVLPGKYLPPGVFFKDGCIIELPLIGKENIHGVSVNQKEKPLNQVERGEADRERWKV